MRDDSVTASLLVIRASTEKVINGKTWAYTLLLHDAACIYRKELRVISQQG